MPGEPPGSEVCAILHNGVPTPLGQCRWTSRRRRQCARRDQVRRAGAWGSTAAARAHGNARPHGLLAGLGVGLLLRLQAQGTTQWATPILPEPLVHTSGVEGVAAGQDGEHLAVRKVLQADGASLRHRAGGAGLRSPPDRVRGGRAGARLGAEAAAGFFVLGGRRRLRPHIGNQPDDLGPIKAADLVKQRHVIRLGGLVLKILHKVPPERPICREAQAGDGDNHVQRRLLSL
mmetsp:Transcript_69621/g.201824  ORF Transcript_69621/g.201824 Transcript_69621/m.201824 type:complete len:232 (-) Transcript_69621:514-1209(-)